VGLTITGVHKEKDGYLLLDLSDGGILYASTDAEGNGPGELFSQHPLVDGRQATVMHFVDSTTGVASKVRGVHRATSDTIIDRTDSQQ
jgi:hypothetical protein